MIAIKTISNIFKVIDSETETAQKNIALSRLARAITHSQGDFSLILASCNSVYSQQQILKAFKKLYSIEIKELFLPASVPTLYTSVKNAIGANQPPAMMVFGLESVEAINQLILSTNLVRDEFSKQFKFPLVLWVNDEILQKLIWLAPDLKNWAGNTIRFDVAEN